MPTFKAAAEPPEAPSSNQPEESVATEPPEDRNPNQPEKTFAADSPEDPSTNQQDQPSVVTSAPRGPWYRNGAAIIGASIVIAAVIIAIAVGTRSSTPPTTTTSTSTSTSTTTTVFLPTGPTLAYMQRTTLKDFNEAEGSAGTQSNCTYIPSHWAPGYSFTCFIYNSSNSELGTVVIISTSSASASQQTWNESYNLG